MVGSICFSMIPIEPPYNPKASGFRLQVVDGDTCVAYTSPQVTDHRPGGPFPGSETSEAAALQMHGPKSRLSID